MDASRCVSNLSHLIYDQESHSVAMTFFVTVFELA